MLCRIRFSILFLISVVFDNVLVCLSMSIQPIPSDSEFEYEPVESGPTMSKGHAVNFVKLDAHHWRSNALDDLDDTLKTKRHTAEAKNVILFLGDGWDVQTMTAARILKGQKVDGLKFGEETSLYLESFPYTGFGKTYCVDRQVAESACSATAYLGGVKGNFGTVGVTSGVKKNNCSAQMVKENQVDSILQWAQAAGKATGIVTTTRITHASPAAGYAHAASRKWESDADVARAKIDTDTCDDIAEQLVNSAPGNKLDVVLGGGRRKFLPTNVNDTEGKFGERKDKKNLIEMWKKVRKENSKGKNVTYVETAHDLDNVDHEKTDVLMGLFSSTHLAYFHDQERNDDPTLAQMTEKAIQILSKNRNGYFLFVEGGRIDHAHHDNQALRSLWETIEFDRAIQLADDMTVDDDTLIVVTSDHAHTMSFAGYALRGNKVNGVAGIADDSLKYSTLNYANGPGFKSFENNMRWDISKDNLDNLRQRQRPLVRIDEGGTHGGQDVPIFAKGPFSHLFTGVHDLTYVPYAMAYASCIGKARTHCDDDNASSGSSEKEH